MFILLFIAIVGAVIAFFSFNRYLQKNERKIYNDIAFLQNGDVAVDQVYFSWLKDFPHLSLVAENVELTDSDIGNQEIPILKNTTLQTRLSIKNWRDKTLEIKQIKLEGGSFYYFRDALKNSNIDNILRGDMSQKGNDHGINVNAEHFNISLINMKAVVVDSSKMMFLDGIVNKFEAEIFNDNLTQACDASMDVQLGKLIFNERGGVFLENALVSGDFKASLKDEYIDINEFPVDINGEEFIFSGHISTNKSSKTTLSFENEQTNLETALPLLPERIRSKIEPLDVKGEFYSKTLVEILAGTNPLVDVKFKIPSNDANIQGLSFQELSVEGQYINRKDYQNIDKNIRKGDYYLELTDVSSEYNRFHVNTPKAIIKGSKFTKPAIIAKTKIQGKAANISKWYQSDKFFFTEGYFDLNIAIDGEINDISKLFIESDATLHLNDLMVYYKPADVAIPIDSMYLFKEAGDATFDVVSTTLVHDYDYELNGGLENLAALINSTVGESSQSTASISAGRLSWQDFVSLFSVKKEASELPKGELETKKSMKETINGIYSKFKPSLTINIDTFDYYDKIQLYNLKTGAFFDSKNYFVLDDTKFNLDQGTVDIKSRLDLSETNRTAFVIDLKAEDIDLETILTSLDYFNIPLLVDLKSYAKHFYVDIHLEGIVNDDGGLVEDMTSGEITFRDKQKEDLNGSIEFKYIDDEMNTVMLLNGNPSLFNSFFATEEFFFQDAGKFETKVNYQGDVRSVAELFDQAKIDFSITKGEVYYDNVDIVFPLERFDVFLEKDTVDFDLLMKSEVLERTVSLDGSANNVSELLFGNTGKKLSTSINLQSPFLKLDDAIFIFQSPVDPEDVKVVTEEKVKILIGSLLNRFNPRVHIELDSFAVDSTISVYNLNTGMHLKDSTNVILEQTTFNFCDGEIGLDLNWDISETKEDPFSGNLSTSKLSLSQLLEKLDYLKIPSLKNAKNIEGEINLDLNFEGRLEDLNLVENDTKAQLDFNIENLRVEGIDIIDDITKKLRISRYFQKIRFAAIANSVTLDGTYIDVPLMEIQSNIGNFFIEGFIDKNNKTNLWLSIPYNNLLHFRKDLDPKKKGYAETRAKLYLEIYALKNGKIETKFHLSKKKFYEQRNKLNEWKIDKKVNQAIRSRLKKSKL
ncbi:hypothetical protein GCM10007940_19140 [Portibacter lacus]|uniref:AsmA-like C-terminal domain-containing protein n=1 Tax=Portibacter lacus TaxID=1099794 RepID=A0AA37SPD9_9BACT|nr:hypothetical protein GCM10007940_19140 [Portibacter lacus]